MMAQQSRIEQTIISNLFHNEEYMRKLLPFVKEEYFNNRVEQLLFGEIFNFLSGTLSTDAIKRTIDSPEEPKWLESKLYLFLAGSQDKIIEYDSITETFTPDFVGGALILL